MFRTDRLFPLSIKKMDKNESSFKWEITAAVLLKFLLLAGLWWFFFDGNKQQVNESIMAGKILGESYPLTQYRNTREHLNDNE